MQNIFLTLNIVAPVFLIIILGILLKKIKLIDAPFINTMSRIVFNVSAPALIFLKIAAADFSTFLDWNQIGLIYIGTLLIVIAVWMAGKLFIKRPEDLAVFIQGTYRSNTAIVGLALILSTFGEVAVSKAAILIAFILPLYNITSVLVLSIPTHHVGDVNWSRFFKRVITNPLILSALIAFPFSYFRIELPQVLAKAAGHIASTALPMALLVIGASLNFKIKTDFKIVFFSSVIKLILLPALLTFAAYHMGIRGENLGILFILFACPTAIVSYVMAEAMNCNGKIAAGIITMTTLGSVITISLGIFILKILGLIL